MPKSVGSIVADRFARRISGSLEYIVWRGGTQIDHVHGANMVLDNAEEAIVQLLGGNLDKAISKIGVGSSAVVASSADTELADVVRADVGAISYPLANKIAVDWEIARGVATGLEIHEFGLFTTDLTLIARKTRAAGIVKGADVRIAGTWTLHF
jgi:hypothetical protein